MRDNLRIARRITGLANFEQRFHRLILTGGRLRKAYHVIGTREHRKWLKLKEQCSDVVDYLEREDDHVS